MVTLVILDGFGESKKVFGNAIKSAGTPNLDKLYARYPHTLLEASGEAVGLPAGQMGNSEVGHLTLGAGRKIDQDLAKINKAIKDGSFYNNSALAKALSHAEKNGTLHIMGLLSDGGVHSSIEHLFAILLACKSYKIKNIFIHAFLDGRDTPVQKGKNFIAQTTEFIDKNQIGNAKIASLCGRIYAMDREKRYDRLQKAYDMLVYGQSFKETSTAQEAIQESYSNGKSDEFVEPVLLDKSACVKDGDSVIFFNYRSDRARELTDAFTNPKFNHFETKSFKKLLFSPMQEYSVEFKHLNTFYPPTQILDNLSAIISNAGKTQFHIAETTKYAHVTFFFNGGIEKPYKGEERKLIESIDTQDFSYYPKMRALEITEATLEAIASEKYDFILVNFSNPDMVGHTGNFEATKEAITCVEKQAYAVALATLMAGGDCIITADHGNAELMIDEKGNKVTSHTNNPVPCILVSEKPKIKKSKLIKHASIANIAPTVLKLLGLDIPKVMEKPLF